MTQEQEHDHRYFAARMMHGARDRNWGTVLAHASTAETRHGGRTAYLLAAAFALAADNTAPPSCRTPRGAPALPALAAPGDVESWVDYAWSAAAPLRALQTPQAERIRTVTANALPLAQEFTDAVHRNDPPGAAALFGRHHLLTGAPGVTDVFTTGPRGLRVALTGYAYTGWLMLAAATAAMNYEEEAPRRP